MPKLDLSGSRYRLEHAKRRIREFEAELIAFKDSSPYAAVRDLDAKTGQAFHKIKLIKPMPVGLSGIGFDVVSGLRSALDLAGASAAIAGGRDPALKIEAKFPFRDDPSQFANAYATQSKHIPKEVFDYMISCKPHKGGNGLLWAINELANTDKHRIVVPYPPHFGLNSAHIVKLSGMAEVTIGAPWDSEKNELILATSFGDAHVEFEINLVAYVTIGQVDFLFGAPADAVFNEFASVVARILDGIEAEATRIGLGA